MYNSHPETVMLNKCFFKLPFVVIFNHSNRKIVNKVVKYLIGIISFPKVSITSVPRTKIRKKQETDWINYWI